MSVGYTSRVSAPEINERVGQLVVNLKSALDEVRKFKAFIDLQFPTDAALKAFMTYDDADVTLFRATLVDLENGRLTLTGARAQPGASNFFFNADKVTGYR